MSHSHGCFRIQGKGLESVEAFVPAFPPVRAQPFLCLQHGSHPFPCDCHCIAALTGIPCGIDCVKIRKPGEVAHACNPSSRKWRQEGQL